MENFILGVIASLIATLIGYIIKKVIIYFQNKSGICGNWNSIIYDDNGNVIKRDEIVLKHNKKTGRVYGTMTRNFPYEQIHRKWTFEGILNGDVLVACVRSQETVNSVCSGCFKLMDDCLFAGYYLRWDNMENKIVKVKIEMKKVIK